MTHRIFSKNRNKYLPQEQFGIMGDGRITELNNKEFSIYDPRGFVIEPWTGYFDKNGKKVYCGDILEMRSMFDFKSKVVWKNGAFKLIPIDPEGIEEYMGQSSVLRGWRITGNVHNVEFLG